MPSALIFDVKSSRQLDDWPVVFKKIEQTLNKANRKFAADILVKFQPTIGDEFQGALKSAEKAYGVYTFIKASLPAQIYCGLGLGEVEMTGKDTAGLRGTAFYRARAALEHCKKEKGLLRIKLSDPANAFSDNLSIILRLVETLELKWTPRQQEVISFLRLHRELKQNSIAQRLKISEPTLSRMLKNAHWEVITTTEKYLEIVLSNYDELS
ncbi:MAG: SatD family protein [bacterium]|nr:SatD family protein [bacterium]